ncbi:MAG: hypothetical protein HXY21_07460 [Parvularculaceae bacterium]|nr:hypothetical protein [Parvularculaceae bacterium]
MLRILLIIAVALAVIIGLMKLTGTRSDDVSPAAEDAAVINDAAEAVDDAAVDGTSDATGAAAGTVGDTLDAPVEAPVDETAPAASETPVVEEPATDPAAEEPAAPN